MTGMTVQQWLEFDDPKGMIRWLMGQEDFAYRGKAWQRLDENLDAELGLTARTLLATGLTNLEREIAARLIREVFDDVGAF